MRPLQSRPGSPAKAISRKLQRDFAVECHSAFDKACESWPFFQMQTLPVWSSRMKKSMALEEQWFCLPLAVGQAMAIETHERMLLY